MIDRTAFAIAAGLLLLTAVLALTGWSGQFGWWAVGAAVALAGAAAGGPMLGVLPPLAVVVAIVVLLGMSALTALEVVAPALICLALMWMARAPGLVRAGLDRLPRRRAAPAREAYAAAYTQEPAPPSSPAWAAFPPSLASSAVTAARISVEPPANVGTEADREPDGLGLRTVLVAALGAVLALGLGVMLGRIITPSVSEMVTSQAPMDASPTKQPAGFASSDGQ